MAIEEWRSVVGYEGLYEVSNFGQVRRLTRKALKPDTDKRPNGGYQRVKLSKKGKPTRFTVHRLVADAFLGPCPEGLERNHKDGRKTNNSADNLEYVTSSENHRHAYRVLDRWRPTGSKHGMSKLTEADISTIRKMSADGEKGYVIAKRFGVSGGTISMILSGTTWKHSPRT